MHSCGFDSIPSDIGVHVLHAQVAADDAGELTDTTLVVTSMRGGMSGGTIDTMRHQLDMTKQGPGTAQDRGQPVLAEPGPGRRAGPGPAGGSVSLPGRAVDPSLRGTLAPFFMAVLQHPGGAAQQRVARLGVRPPVPLPRGDERRHLAAVPGARRRLKIGLGALVCSAMSLPPTRFVLDRLLPKPGDGPDERTRARGHFTMDIFTTTTTGERYKSRFRAKGDPGYAATAVMLGESALALALDRDELPPSEGGVLTPATGIGDALVKRLRAAGIEISRPAALADR